MDNVRIFSGISREKLEDILIRIRDIRVALIGDLCLDVYWKADMTRSELSRETPHFTLPVIEERMSPGAGGNTAANIAALQVGSVQVLGVVGRDWRGEILRSKLQESGIDTSGIVISEKSCTNAYCKPLRKGISPMEYEDPRIDFANYQDLSEEDEEQLILSLRLRADELDVLCVTDQLLHGCITPAARREILSLAEKGVRVVVDSRERIGLYKGVTLKPNEVEGMRALFSERPPAEVGFEDFVRAARILSERNSSSVCMTLGPRGCLYVDSRSVTHIPSFHAAPPIDICGAGDTFLSAFSCALATGADPCEAASFANLAADVTIRKIGTTGTASPQEIRERHERIVI
jgi:rfaE bifunctional protein kinase chain/domain